MIYNMNSTKQMIPCHLKGFWFGFVVLGCCNQTFLRIHYQGQISNPNKMQHFVRDCIAQLQFRHNQRVESASQHVHHFTRRCCPLRFIDKAARRKQICKCNQMKTKHKEASSIFNEHTIIYNLQ